MKFTIGIVVNIPPSSSLRLRPIIDVHIACFFNIVMTILRYHLFKESTFQMFSIIYVLSLSELQLPLNMCCLFSGY
uniref:Uncharacterized protein n=1 Tax=Arundo donax TaxID=35708 RepID=A0A0A9FPN2_ARUDO